MTAVNSKGGVRINFVNAFMGDAVVRLTLEYKNTTGLDPALLPRVLTRSNILFAYEPVETTTEFLIKEGTEWLEFVLEWDYKYAGFGAQYTSAKFGGNVVVTLKAADMDPQLHSFGERSYNITFKNEKPVAGNEFVSQPPANNQTIYPIPGAYLTNAIFYTRNPLVKGRTLKILDAMLKPMEDNEALASLSTLYPPDPDATEAPWPIVTNVGLVSSLMCKKPSLPYTELMQGMNVPPGYQGFNIRTGFDRDFLANSLEAVRNLGWTSATSLFDEFYVTSVDYGAWAPYFLGKDIAFVTEPFRQRVYTGTLPP